MAYVGMAYLFVAYVGMADIVMIYIAIGYLITTPIVICDHDLFSHDLYSLLRYFPVLFIKTAAGLQIEWVWEHGRLKLGAVLQSFSKQYMWLLANSIAATSSAH